MSRIVFLVQASSISWSGGPDLCMNQFDNKPIVQVTTERIFKFFPEAKVIVIAPSFDKDGKLEDLISFFPNRLDIYYGYDDSPLHRMISATEFMFEDDYFVRLDGLNMWFDTGSILKMIELAESNDLDMVKFPDDFPVQFTFEVYKGDYQDL